MIRAIFLSVLLLAVAEGTTAGPRRIAHDEADLLSGVPFGLPRGVPPPLQPSAVVALDDDMRAFIAETARGGDALSKLNGLIAGMRERGLFTLDYTVDETLPARESFHSHRGNCLSFTLLFVALAREAGLDVSFQTMDVPPTWQGDESDLVVVSRHVNALVDIPHGSQYVVDFNSGDFRAHYARRAVSDARALALFYNNLGAEALIAKQYSQSFRYLRASLAADSKISSTWANLGLLYWRTAHSELAESAYRQALEVDPDDGTALTNLANLYSALGRSEVAAEYRRRVRNYQAANPYYHYALAQRAFDAEQFEAALRAVHDAIRRKRDEPRFYELQGRAYLELGRRRNAERSFERARDYAVRATTPRYDTRTAALGTDVPTQP